ncbi:galactose-1-phosphate uridylyltransferase [Candidatus Roizmanbacteria bacterium CG11_big_fil_rev_8_21_14_0_20_36_8]|uniref:Galactose-1-phosphate uridylyltransferase n=2 Tax=Candidatus Roizmaniibacteriota TaxID=1752723 RepID=A0A2M6IUP3_9BACT|nr:MAG: galactose-1-phosphate uridylyltransferase [Candidatus Roizmanbacteria bacterium CG11_big_fil_rev_8_21_14_0_20_36_8]PIZ65941.1 MAG: galactose-1-phosphate uridylyltransferase [Candidatus Roizmanbacteria bacterium CG_4_10_14_0_2_um_filter_36_9]
MFDHPHRRFNPLIEEWVLISPQRSKRPWKGALETPQIVNLPKYDKNCYLCPGNKRINGDINSTYESTYVFDNDYQAIESNSPNCQENDNPFFKLQSVKGKCKVVCFSPRHDKTLGSMTTKNIQKVITVWQKELQELGKQYSWVQIFENKGDIMGCSNSHPHSQIWASSTIPTEIQKESMNQKDYLKNNKSQLLLDYVQQELDLKTRVVAKNSDWVVIVPYWAVWPYETMILPTKKVKRLEDIDDKQKNSLAKIMKVLLIKYDSMFNTSFPYSMGWHFAPYTNENYDHWQLHAHYYPPLLRSETIKKHLVGYEMLAEAQRDITPETAALKLREL